MNRVLKLLVLTLAFAGTNTCKNPASGVETDLVEAKAKWEAVGYSKYQMQFGTVCECLYGGYGFGGFEATFDVDAGVVIGVREVWLSGGLASDSLIEAWNNSVSNFQSIEGLFGVIESAIEENAHEVDITYNAELGYPEKIKIDYDKMVADEEKIYSVSHVVENQEPL